MASTSVARVANMNTNDGRHYTKHFSLEAGRMPALLICTRQEMWPLVAYLTLRSDGSGYSSLADVVTISNGLITNAERLIAQRTEGESCVECCLRF